MFIEKRPLARRVIGLALAFSLGSGALAACSKSEDPSRGSSSSSESPTSLSVDSTLLPIEAKAVLAAKMLCESDKIKNVLGQYAGRSGSVSDCEVSHPVPSEKGKLDIKWEQDDGAGDSTDVGVRIASYVQPIDESDNGFMTLPGGTTCTDMGEGSNTVIAGHSALELCNGHGLTYLIATGINDVSIPFVARVETEGVTKALDAELADLG